MGTKRKFKVIFIPFFIVLGALLFTLAAPTIVQAQAPTSVQVVLAENLTSALLSVGSGQYEFKDALGRSFTLAMGSQYNVVPSSSTGIKVLDALGNPVDPLVSEFLPPLTLAAKKLDSLDLFAYGNKKYRGDLRIIVNLSNNSLNLINSVETEKYLYGVVGSEIGSASPDEALKAQAVVSRSYVSYYFYHPKYKYQLPDGSVMSVTLDCTTKSQVFNGYSGETDRVRAAVDATIGEIIYYQGKEIPGYFYSNAGGYTEDAANVWGNNVPYLKAVPSPYDNYVNKLSAPGQWPAVAYQWTKSFSKEELETIFQVGALKEIKINKVSTLTSQETKSGRVITMEVVGANGSKVYEKDRIRTPLQLRSTLFNLVVEESLPQAVVQSTSQAYAVDGSGNVVPVEIGGQAVLTAEGQKTLENNFVVGITTQPAKFTFNGKGYGHGVGLSQWGARGMASDGGYNYKQIIEHYYNKAQLGGALQISK